MKPTENGASVLGVPKEVSRKQSSDPTRKYVSDWVKIGWSDPAGNGQNFRGSDLQEMGKI